MMLLFRCPSCPDARSFSRRLKQPRRAPFAEACRLAECYGFTFARQRGSHRIYKAPGQPELINLQDVKGYAKTYQVMQILDIIESSAQEGKE